MLTYRRLRGLLPASLAAAACIAGLVSFSPPSLAEDPARIDAIVGEWDQRGSNVTFEIRRDHTVFHSNLGKGVISHEVAENFVVSYPEKRIDCRYTIKKYSDDEISIRLYLITDPADCELGDLRRSSSSKTKAEAPHASQQAEHATASAGTSFRDCETCPEMVIVAAGSFLMGSPDSERGRRALEGPQQTIQFAKAFAAGRYPVTKREFGAFVADTNYNLHGGCNAEINNAWTLLERASALDPVVFDQDDRHPAVCVSWEDAQAFVAWLSKRTGQTYRLLTETEREYVARAGTTSAYSWGEDITPQNANYDRRDRGTAKATTPTAKSDRIKRGKNLADNETADKQAQATFSAVKSTPVSSGGASPSPDWGTVPVAAYPGNNWGFFSTHGNTAEWTADCWTPTLAGIPRDGSVWKSGDCSKHAVRGGGWSYWPEDIRSAYREAAGASMRFFHVGFRVARDLPNG